MPSKDYGLGYADSELDRLDLQGALYRDITRRAFRDAGVRNGLKVLDIGCGTGDVSRLCGKIVGPSGWVLGIDHDPGTVEAAERRTVGGGLKNVAFR